MALLNWLAVRKKFWSEGEIVEKKDLINVVDNFKDVGIEISETVLDSLLADSFLKNIPFFNLIISMFKTGKHIKDILYMKKLAAFIYGYADLAVKIDAKIENAINDVSKLQDLGEQILLIIEKVDSTKKAKLIGRACKLLKETKISSTIFLRLCHMINKSFYDDLLSLTKVKNSDEVLNAYNDIIEDMVLVELYSNGWLSELGFDGSNSFGSKNSTRYKLNSYAKIVILLLVREYSS